jgi:hypothetical protein
MRLKGYSLNKRKYDDETLLAAITCKIKFSQAEILKELGVSVSTVRHIEKGTKHKHLKEIAVENANEFYRHIHGRKKRDY